MPLKTERRPISTRHTLERAIEKRAMCRNEMLGQTRLVDRETVILRRDEHAPGLQILDGMVRAVVTEFHLHRTRTTRETEQLVAETNSEYRHILIENLSNRSNRVIARLRIAGAVREKNTFGREREDICRTRLRRHDRHLAARVDEQAKDVVLDAVVVGHHTKRPMVCASRRRRIESAALRPLEALARRDDFGEIHTLQSREGSRADERLALEALERITCFAGDDAARLSPALSEDSCKATGIDIRNGDDALPYQKFRQRLLHAPVAGARRKVSNYEACRVRERRLHVVGIGTDVADMRIREGDDLFGVGRVGKDFLIPGESSIENDLSRGLAGRTDRAAAEESSVSQRQHCIDHLNHPLLPAKFSDTAAGFA